MLDSAGPADPPPIAAPSTRRPSTLFARATRRKDAVAGLTLGLEGVPDGLAAGLLAGLNPVSGLYGYMVGTLAGALTTSSVFMSVQATGAMSVLIADVPQVRGGANANASLVTLAVLTGLVMLLLGLLRLGTLVRFIPNSVLTGFVNAVAINIVLGQFANFTGYAASGGNRVVRGINTLLHVTSFDWATVAIGAVTIILILVLERTRLGSLGLVVAVVVTSALVPLLHWDSVQQLSDIANIPNSLPRPELPSLALMGPLVIPALSLAFIGLVQGSAIGQSVPNPDGTYPDASGDFRGQGVANIASGMLQGMPVGGSMSATALVTAAGARTRLANIIASVVMAGVILLFGSAAGYIAMPALAALLILVGFRTFKIDRVLMVWKTGPTNAAVMVTTFALTMLIPLQYAVLAGVAISVILFVARQSNKVTLVRWTFSPGSTFPQEGPAPATLPANQTVVLMAYGSLFFASAAVVESQFPVVTEMSHNSVVILRVRGKEDLGSTFIRVLTRYAEALQAVDSHLLLSGVGHRVYYQLESTGAAAIIGHGNIFRATPEVGRSLEAARMRAAELLTDSSRSKDNDPPS